MIRIRPIQPEDVPAVKRLIGTVAYGIFGWDGSLEDSLRHFSASGDFADMDDLSGHYFDRGGLFLIALDDAQLIGSGALRKLDDETAELKRMWLAGNYQGRGIGFRILTHLFDFARQWGYTRVRLQTSREQTRAIGFYRRVGFYEIAPYAHEPDDVSMEIMLEGTKSS